MGEELFNGYLFMKDLETGEICEIRHIEALNTEVVAEYFDENLKIIREASLELTLDVAPEEFGDKRISQKRFRKLLYSGGYGRNDVNEIIKCEQSKGYYLLSDVEYWNKYKEIFEEE